MLGTSLAVRDVNWVSIAGIDGPSKVRAKIRYNSDEADAEIVPAEDGQVVTRLIEPQRAISPGQAVVWYDGDYLVGGGIIDRQLSGPQTDAEGLQSVGHTITVSST